MLTTLMSLLLELSSYIHTIQHSLSHYIPALANQYVFAGCIGTAIAIPILAILLLSDWDSRLPPRMSVLIPALTGQLNLAKEGPIHAVRRGFQKYGEIFRMKLFHRGFTFMIGHEAHEKFFMSKDDLLAQRDVYGFTVPVFGKNIVYDADPLVMIQQLKFVRNGLTGDIMMTYVPKIVKEVQDYFGKWPEKGEIDFHHVLSEITILTASRCLLGDEIRDKVHVEFAEWYQRMNDGMTHLSVFWPYAPTKAHKLRDEARVEIARIFGKVIRDRRAAQAKGAEKPSDYLQILIDAEYRDGTQPTDDEIVGLLLAALFAGQHTSNLSSTWMAYLINLHPEIIPKLRSEQKEVLASTNGELNFDALNRMELLHATMKEALRMFPPLVLLMRKVKHTFMYKNFLIPEGDIVVTCPPVAHRIPEVWSNPDQFDPERFTVRHEGEQKHDFIAFGGGRHRCLGENFGFLQVKTIMSYLLRHFDFELINPSKPVVDYSSIVAGPGNDTRARYVRKAQPVC